MKQTNKKLTALSAILLLLAACDEPRPNLRDGALDARYFQKHVHKQYLDCYALDKSSKAVCVEKLHKKYTSPELQEHTKYLRQFQYEAEKLGFKYFLNDAGKPCDAINEGPIFDEQEQRYLVKCESGKTYLMHFDYDTKEWQLEG